MEEAGVEAYVKYNRFHLEQRPRYVPDPFHQDSLYYNKEEDYYVCPMWQHMERTGTHRDDPGKDRKRIPYLKRRLSSAKLQWMPTPLPVLQGKDGQAHHRG